MDDSNIRNTVKELHRDLSAKYRRDSVTVEQYWRGFDQSQRTQCIKAGAADGVVLKHSLDRSLGDVYKIVPELNLRDVTDPNSDFLLDHLRHRATTSLRDQYAMGLNNSPGDHDFIRHMMNTRNLGLANVNKKGFTIFIDDDGYGQSLEIVRNASEVWANLAPAVNANLCVPQERGELILQRQLYMLQSLNIAIDDILDIGSMTRDRKTRSKPSRKAATEALSKLSIKEPTEKASPTDLIQCAADQQSMLAEYLSLLSTEPTVLAHAINICFFTRPELLPDEKGRVLPVHTDRYISGAVLEAVYDVVEALAVWTYIGRLLDLLAAVPSTDKVYKPIILQEISNVCHHEYSRAQALFKRNVQTASGNKWFRRISNVRDRAGNVRVTLHGNPDDLTQRDPQLHYVLRLCQSETSAAKAKEWIKKLNDLHQAHPSELEKLEEREADSLSDLIVITSFIKDLSPAFGMPSLSRKKNQVFARRSQQLNAEISDLKPKIDLSELVVPIDNILEPDVGPKTLLFLDHFIIERLGTKMGFLYEDLIEECLAELETQYQSAKNKAEMHEAAAQLVAERSMVPETTTASTPQKLIIEQRKQKEKTRPSHSSVFDIVAPPSPPTEEPTLWKKSVPHHSKSAPQQQKSSPHCSPNQNPVAA